MKLICFKSDFEKSLTTVIRAVPSRPTHPILSNILFKVGQDKITLTGFDLSMGIRSTFQAQTNGNQGSFTLPANLLQPILSKLPDGEISLEIGDVEDESFLATLTTQSGKFQIRGIGSEEFPSLPIVQGTEFSIPSTTLLQSLKTVSAFASNDATKQILCGIRLTKLVDGLESAATDGHRLGVTKMELESESEFSFTIPTYSAKEVEKMLNGTEECFVKLEESLAVFSVNNQTLITRLLDGTYPNYQQLIPSKFVGECVLNRKEFIQAIELVAVVSDQKNNLLHITFDPADGAVTVVSETADIGSASQLLLGEVTCDTPITIGFNIKYLLEGVKNITSTDIKIKWNDPTTPVILTPLGELNHLHLIMPVKLVR